MLFPYQTTAGIIAVTLLLLLRAGCDSGPIPIVESVPLDQMPAWSPDGTRVAYWHYNPDAGDSTYVTGLYVLDIESGERHLVIEGFASAPDWSHDGERIAFSTRDIFTIRPDGSDLRRITTHGSSFRPRWSPDGGSISFGRSGTQEEVGIWFFHLADSCFRRFGFGATPADWSPEGKRIVYEGPQGKAEGGNQIWVADTSGENAVQLTANNLLNGSPAWSPDGTLIAWTAGGDGEEYSVWLMQADGSNPRRLVDSFSAEPAWHPDGNRLAFSGTTASGDKGVLWTINRDGSGLRQLTF